MTTLSFNKKLENLKSCGQDFNWYPTGKDILKIVSDDIKKERSNSDCYTINSILDIGAGDGQALDYFKNQIDYKFNFYAIEKSHYLCQHMDKEIVFLGSDLFDGTLIDKKVDVIFTNPAFHNEAGKELFPEWVEKVITEANAKLLYIVIPKRWVEKKIITDAIDARVSENKFTNKKYEILDTLPFDSAGREANTTVDIIKIDLRGSVDAFNLWLSDNFNFKHKEELFASSDEANNDDNQLKYGVAEREAVIPTLIKGYNQSVDHLMNQYQQIGNLDADLMLTLGLNIDSAVKAIQLKTRSIKDKYWELLFNNLIDITSRVTHEKRVTLLDKMKENGAVDFNAMNIHQIVLWVIKNVNSSLEPQFLSFIDRFLNTNQNTKTYKSNTKLYDDDEWRYLRTNNRSPEFKLETRLIVSTRNNNFIDDLLVTAYNLGFDCLETLESRLGLYDTYNGEALKNAQLYTVKFKNHQQRKEEVLFTYKRYNKAGTYHIKLNTNLAMAINCEIGRLRGWLKSAKDASEELDINLEEAFKSFGSTVHISEDIKPINQKAREKDDETEQLMLSNWCF